MPTFFDRHAIKASRVHTVLVMLCILVATLVVSKTSHAQTHATMQVVSAEQSSTPLSDDGSLPVSDDADECVSIDIDDFVIPLVHERVAHENVSIFEIVDLSLTLPALGFGPVEPPELV